MQESLPWCWWWWWCLWWACVAAPAVVVAAAAGQGHCEVLDLSLQPSAYPLPTNLTVRPSVTGWHLNFTLQEGEAPPAACVRLKETESKVQLMLYKGDCVHGKIQRYNYLPPHSVPPHAWTSLAVDVNNSVIFLTAPNSRTISLKAYSWSLPRDALQVTLAQGVEVAVGCHVNCPLYSHASEGQDFEKKVKEWHHEKLHFYFRPGPTFGKVHYEVMCGTRRDSEFRHGVDIKPGKDDAAGAWHLVKLEQRESKAEVHLNGRLLEQIQLPDSCTSNMHVVWTVGDAAFGFDCDPREEDEREERDPGGKGQPDGLMYLAVSPWVALAVILVIVVAAYIIRRRRKSSKRSQGDDMLQICEQAAVTTVPHISLPPSEDLPQTHKQAAATTNVSHISPPPSEDPPQTSLRDTHKISEEKALRFNTRQPGTQRTYTSSITGRQMFKERSFGDNRRPPALTTTEEDTLLGPPPEYEVIQETWKRVDIPDSFSDDSKVPPDVEEKAPLTQASPLTHPPHSTTAEPCSGLRSLKIYDFLRTSETGTRRPPTIRKERMQKTGDLMCAKVQAVEKHSRMVSSRSYSRNRTPPTFVEGEFSTPLVPSAPSYVGEQSFTLRAPSAPSYVGDYQATFTSSRGVAGPRRYIENNTPPTDLQVSDEFPILRLPSETTLVEKKLSMLPKPSEPTLVEKKSSISPKPSELNFVDEDFSILPKPSELTLADLIGSSIPGRPSEPNLVEEDYSLIPKPSEPTCLEEEFSILDLPHESKLEEEEFSVLQTPSEPTMVAGESSLLQRLSTTLREGVRRRRIHKVKRTTSPKERRVSQRKN